jgi:two-component system, chemotaxis family, chemotaxis protein CheY
VPAPILIVEDDEDTRELMRHVLEDAGYRTAIAVDGREALDVVAQVGPGLILLDVRMPQLDGVAFAQAYHAGPGPHAPVIVLTASHDPVTLGRQIGAVASLAKPFDIGDLLACVARVLSPD